MLDLNAVAMITNLTYGGDDRLRAVWRGRMQKIHILMDDEHPHRVSGRTTKSQLSVQIMQHGLSHVRVVVMRDAAMPTKRHLLE